MRRVQNLGQAKFLQKPNAQAKSAQKPNDWASFHDFQSAKIENFQEVGHFFTLLHIFCQKLKKPNARAKFTSQNLMPWQKLTPEIPNARARTFVPTFIRESPLPSFVSQLYMFHQRNTQF